MSEDLSARLRRLRREPAPPVDTPPAATPVAGTVRPRVSAPDDTHKPDTIAPPRGRARGSMPLWLVQRLRRRKDRATLAGPRPTDVPVPSLAPRSSGEPAGLVKEDAEDGHFFARSTDFSVSDAHGDWTLDEVDSADADTIALLTGDPALAQLDLRSCVYLDTETTGLSGGAGVYVYMVGLGFFEGDRFRLWQGFLRSPREERVLLAEVARRIRSASAIVSFFGKSFDRHRLDDKMAIAGVPSPFAGLPHLDLYHPFQRLTRKRLVDGRLATMEATLCGLAREDDLPGAFAPEAWFDFLAERPHRLEGVFRHNRDDVLSLVTLAAYLGRVRAESRADGSALVGPAGARARGVARSHVERGERREALPWVERALERERADGLDVRDLLFARGELLRRLDEHAAALETFAELEQGDADRWTLRALVESSKVLEHKLKDPARALEACRRGLQVVARVCAGGERTRFEEDLKRREARLTGKIG